MDFLIAQANALKDAVQAQGLDSAILGEQFYFFTVVLMWLIHVGFMTYETGIARRKNALATAMKNILTIAVVTPTFYYFGWWIYNCNQAGLPIGPNSADFTSVACQGGIPWSDAFGPNLTNNINLVFFLAFLLFSWTTASIMSGALLERVRLSAYLVLAVLLGSVVWILDAAWGWSAGGWMTLRFGFHDSIASGVVHGVSGAFTLGVLFNLGPRIGKYTKDGLSRIFRPHNVHMTLMGLMLIFTGFYGFYAACLVIASTAFPGWATIYLNPTTLGSIAMIITMGFAGGFTGGYFAAKGDPFWTVSGGLAGVISVSAGADVYAPTLGYLLAMISAIIVVWVGTWIEEKMRVDDIVGAVAVHGFTGFLALIWVGIFAAGYPTGLNNVESSMWRPAVRDRRLPAARFPLGLVRFVAAEEVQPAAGAARGRARRARHGRVRTGHPCARVRVGRGPRDRAGRCHQEPRPNDPGRGVRGACPVPEWRPCARADRRGDLNACGDRQRPVVYLQ